MFLNANDSKDFEKFRLFEVERLFEFSLERSVILHDTLCTLIKNDPRSIQNLTDAILRDPQYIQWKNLY